MSNTTLPTRFHIGTQKAGSTFLYNLLASHPKVSLSTQTEIHYYSKYFDRGNDWYSSLFTGDGVRIDTSPKYFMYAELAAPRIKAATGESARLLLIIRNPIDLLNSHYQMHAVSGHFHKHPDVYPIVPSSVVDCARRYPDYLKQANYHSQLQQWLEHFDQSQIKVIIFEEFIKNNQQSMVEILEFWQLPPAELTSTSTSKNKMLKNRFLFNLKSAVVRITWLKNLLKGSRWFGYLYDHYLTENSGKKITADTRAQLAAMLETEVTNLEQLLGREITSWEDFHPKH